MNQRDRKELARYVRHIADEMGLRDWTFEVKVGDPDEEDEIPNCDDALASIECVDGRKFAIITFVPDSRKQPPEELRDTVVHELIHAHLNPACEIVRVDAKDGFSQATYEMLMMSFRRSIEYAVDGLAEVISKQFPLIEWPKGKGK